MDRGGWWAAVHGVTRVRHDLTTKPRPPPPVLSSSPGGAVQQQLTLLCSPIQERQHPPATSALG